MSSDNWTRIGSIIKQIRPQRVHLDGSVNDERCSIAECQACNEEPCEASGCQVHCLHATGTNGHCDECGYSENGDGRSACPEGKE